MNRKGNAAGEEIMVSKIMEVFEMADKKGRQDQNQAREMYICY